MMVDDSNLTLCCGEMLFINTTKLLHMHDLKNLRLHLLFAQGCAGKRGYIGYKGDKVKIHIS